MPSKTFGKNQNLFSETILPEGNRRWRSFGAGFTVELIILGCAIWIPMLFPQQMVAAKEYMMTEITAPSIDIWKPKPVVKPRPVPVKRVEVAKVEPVVPDPPKPKIIEPVFEKPVAPKPVVKKMVQAPELKEFAKALPTPNPLDDPKTDLKKPMAPVQTGGFGDPHGLPAADKVTHVVNINQTGAFDMPPGAGKGNGTGGAKGVVGTAGFGAETATTGSRRSGSVQAGGFSDESVATKETRAKKASGTPAEEPVVVLSKPQPEYTAEGKQQKIQGEVLLAVVFRASGQVDVERVVKGLGYGLDANAEAAARQIRFTPAKQDGHAVDFPAIVRIDFELAY